MQACSMGHLIPGKRKRGTDESGWSHGASSSGPSSVVMDGSWLNLQRLTGARLVLTDDAREVVDNEWTFDPEELGEKLQENALMLIKDGEVLRVE